VRFLESLARRTDVVPCQRGSAVKYQLSYWPFLLFWIGCQSSPPPDRQPSPSVATDPHATDILASSTPTPKPSRSVATDPRATDSLARLKRVLLTTSDPHAVRQLMICEEMRLYSRLGVAEGRLRMKGMTDTIYKTRADTIAAERADSKLALNLFTVDSFECASFEDSYRKKRADSLAQHSK
jgi:hypothetical protein